MTRIAMLPLLLALCSVLLNAAEGQLGPAVSVARPPPPPPPVPAGGSFEPVAFSAVRATENSRRSSGAVEFSSTLTDVGYGWNPGTNRFECFYPGVYFFSFSGLSASGSQFRMALMHNNRETVALWGSANFNGGSNSAVLNLRRGDTVYLQKTEGILHEPQQNPLVGYTSFSGFRISGPVN